MVRLASVGDAGELERLNAEFNGKGKTTEESIRASLLTNRREIVIVADGNGGRLAGFVCVQRRGCEQTEPIAQVEVACHIVEARNSRQQRRALQRGDCKCLQAARTNQRQHCGQGVEGNVHCS